jgi:hypothetical protein
MVVNKDLGKNFGEAEDKLNEQARRVFIRHSPRSAN